MGDSIYNKPKIIKMKYLKRFWNWLLGKTTIDEKIEAKVDEVVEEVKERDDRIKEEFSDVKEAISEVADQAGDVIDAAKGKKRRGRPKKK